MTKIGLVSLGCSKNLIDSEVMLGYLTQSGYEVTNHPSEAEVLVVNTCGFIESAKRESIDAILEMAEYKRQGACKTLVVTGCLSQRYGNELQSELPEVDIFLGVNDYESLPALLNRRHAPNMILGPMKEKRILATPSHYAYLRIAEGCDNRCSFCAIPLIRGAYRSRPFQEIIREAEELVERGVQELIIIAQDTTRYGIDLYGEKKLPSLLNALCALDGLRWVRLLYAYPRDITESLLDTIITQEKICNYLDIPLQHVDDNLLRRMGRRSSMEEIAALYRRIRTLDPDFALRTTLISGFPGESEEQHRSLLSFMRDHPFDRAGVFAYSAEEGTPAASFPNQVDKAIAARRAKEIMAQQAQISAGRLQRRLGREYTVLVDGYDERTALFHGRSYGEAPEIDGRIFFASRRACSTASFVQVRIERSEEHDLYGVEVETTQTN